jgi:hypothetical protein
MGSADTQQVLKSFLGFLVGGPCSHAVNDRLCEVRIFAITIRICVVFALGVDL